MNPEQLLETLRNITSPAIAMMWDSAIRQAYINAGLNIFGLVIAIIAFIVVWGLSIKIWRNLYGKDFLRGVVNRQYGWVDVDLGFVLLVSITSLAVFMAIIISRNIISYLLNPEFHALMYFLGR